jgi:hypothetical protein
LKLIIAGGRKYVFTQMDRLILELLHREYGITEVVCGMAKGADLAGKAWAEERGIHVEPFKADWSVSPRGAGHIRNRKMADYADAVILFPGGRGTNNMYDEAKKRGLTIFDFRNRVSEEW